MNPACTFESYLFNIDFEQKRVGFLPPVHRATNSDIRCVEGWKLEQMWDTLLQEEKEERGLNATTICEYQLQLYMKRRKYCSGYLHVLPTVTASYRTLVEQSAWTELQGCLSYLV
jgi:hypothetical protein